MKGVSYHQKRGKWSARLMINGKRVFLGYRDSEVDATAILVRRQVEEQSRANILEAQKDFTLDNHRVEYIQDDVSFQWINEFREKQLKELVRYFRSLQVAVLVSLRRFFKKLKM